jgi:hypothetical protein
MQELELKEVDAAFGPQGIPSFVLEGVLGELQAAASTYLSQLASGMSLELTATKPTAAAAKGKGTGNGRPKKAASKGRSKAAAKVSATCTWVACIPLHLLACAGRE